MTGLAALLAWCLTTRPPPSHPIDQFFRADVAGEAVASIVAGCARCDWSVPGREAVLLELSVDGVYSQHLALTRGETPAEYRVMLGPITAGPHHLVLTRDAARSARDAGEVTLRHVGVQVVGQDSRDYAWLARAPVLRARPGTVERFSDFPLVMYAERGPG